MAEKKRGLAIGPAALVTAAAGRVGGLGRNGPGRRGRAGVAGARTTVAGGLRRAIDAMSAVDTTKVRREASRRVAPLLPGGSGRRPSFLVRAVKRVPRLAGAAGVTAGVVMAGREIVAEL